jgi:phosphoenolpyruvate synthase/pyruvate phosphate dikinase
MQKNLDDVLRILIIDDDIHVILDTEFLFKNIGIRAEAVVAESMYEGVKQIEEWAAQGHKADIIDIDYYVPLLARMPMANESEFKERVAHIDPRDISGVDITRFFVDWGDEQPEHLRPSKFFMHSKVPQNIPALLRDYGLKDIVKIHHINELMDIALNGEYGPHLDESSDTKMREYLNKVHGTNFPLQKYHINMIKNPEEPLDASDVYYEVHKGWMEPEEALRRMDISSISRRLSNQIDFDECRKSGDYRGSIHFEKGMGEALSGRAAFKSDDIQNLRELFNDPIILILNAFQPADTALLNNVEGIALIGEGTEHLEMVASNHDISGIFGCTQNDSILKDSLLEYTPRQGKELTIKAGDWITINNQIACYYDGEEAQVGALYAGKVPIKANNPEDISWLEDAMAWAKDVLQNVDLIIKANADTPEQVERAIELGTAGVGLLRTEHMFFAEDRLPILQQVLFASNKDQQDEALKKLKQAQKEDFIKIYKSAMKANDYFPISVRLLDPSADEFIPSKQIDSYLERIGKGNERGAQLALQIPGLYAAQAEAIFEAIIETGYDDMPEIMIPNINSAKELRILKADIDAVAEKCGFKGKYLFGSMIETLSAVEDAGKIAKISDFISFGTNDLTTEVMDGIKRNNIVETREWMIKNGHRQKSPFIRLAKPVIELMDEAVNKAKETNPYIDIRVCGQQIAKDVKSIQICHSLGVHCLSMPASNRYIIPSMFAMAQAVVKEKHVLNNSNNNQNYNHFEM